MMRAATLVVLLIIGVHGVVGAYDRSCPEGMPGFSGPPGMRGEPGEEGFKGLPGEPGLVPMVDPTRLEKGDSGIPGPPAYSHATTRSERSVRLQSQSHQEGDQAGDITQRVKRDFAEGPRGQAGYPGLPGLKGFPGPMGNPGDVGLPAPLTFIKGQKGEKGLKGICVEGYPPTTATDDTLSSRRVRREGITRCRPGPPGHDGLPGYPGIKGERGPVGFRGPPGFPGEVFYVKGDRGDPGDPGTCP